MPAERLALVAVQVVLAMHDLESPRRFRRLIDGMAARAATECGDAEHRLFVFPEAIGHFLPLTLAPSGVLERATLSEAFAALAMRRPLSVLRGMVDAGGLGLRKGVLRAILPDADRIMRGVFSAVARAHRATVVAGSHLRAQPGGRITNTSYTFEPGGRLVAATDKVNLVPTLEDGAPGGLGLSRGDPDGVGTVAAAWGKVATLVCYDGFREPHTRSERFADMGPRVDAAGADVIANPAANPWAWDAPWHFAEPGEDILRRDQWRAEGLPATLATLRTVRYGVTAHLCGVIFDQRFEGRSEVLERTSEGVRVLAQAATCDQGEAVAAVVDAPGGAPGAANLLG